MTGRVFYNSGTLGKNQRRRSNDDSEYAGQANIRCPGCGQDHEFWVNADVKQNRQNGSKFFGLRLSPKRKRGGQQGGGPQAPDAGDYGGSSNTTGSPAPPEGPSTEQPSDAYEGEARMPWE